MCFLKLDHTVLWVKHNVVCVFLYLWSVKQTNKPNKERSRGRAVVRLEGVGCPHTNKQAATNKQEVIGSNDAGCFCQLMGTDYGMMSD